MPKGISRIICIISSWTD